MPTLYLFLSYIPLNPTTVLTKYLIWIASDIMSILVVSQTKTNGRLGANADDFINLYKRPLLADSRSPAISSERQLWGKQTLKLDESAAIGDPKQKPGI
jgi:hypothetical protein